MSIAPWRFIFFCAARMTRSPQEGDVLQPLISSTSFLTSGPTAFVFSARASAECASASPPGLSSGWRLQSFSRLTFHASSSVMSTKTAFSAAGSRLQAAPR